MTKKRQATRNILGEWNNEESEKVAILQGLRGLVTVRYLDPELRIVWDNVNGNPSNGFGRTGSRAYCYEIIRGRKKPCSLGCTPIEALESGKMREKEAVQDDGRIFVERSTPVKDNTGAIHGVVFVAINITERKRAEQELAKQEAEVRRKSRQLEETNTALRVLLKQQVGDQRELEERIVANVRQLVLPYIRKLKGMRLTETQKSYLEIVETHLHDIVAPFLRKMVSEYPHMTAKEIQVATLVRDGKSNKDIAELMHLSVNTVESHRHNLRKKLGLQNNKINLRSYLLSLNTFPKGNKADKYGPDA